MDSLLRHLNHRHHRLACGAAKHLKEHGVDRRIRALEERLREMKGGPPGEHRDRARLDRVLRATRRQAVAAKKKSTVGSVELHHARIALKRYRLMVEAAQALDCAVPNLSGVSRELQILGKIHDSDVLLACLAKCANREIIATETAARLGRRLEQRRAKLVAEQKLRKFRRKIAKPCGAESRNLR
jgi:CHAD domain-containing protein